MSAPAEEFYSEERWQNWIERIRDEELDPEDEQSARLLLNLQDDVSIAVAKIIRAVDDGQLDEENAVAELATIHEITNTDPEFADEDKTILVNGVQISLDCVFYSAQRYVAEGVVEDGTVGEYIRAAAEAEAEEDFDRALSLVAGAGTRVIDGAEFDIGVIDELEPGYVTEWLNGLDSLKSALSDPEVIEE